MPEWRQPIGAGRNQHAQRLVVTRGQPHLSGKDLADSQQCPHRYKQGKQFEGQCVRVDSPFGPRLVKGKVSDVQPAKAVLYSVRRPNTRSGRLECRIARFGG